MVCPYRVCYVVRRCGGDPAPRGPACRHHETFSTTLGFLNLDAERDGGGHEDRLGPYCQYRNRFDPQPHRWTHDGCNARISSLPS